MSASRFHAVRKILKLEDLGPPFAGSVPQKPYPSVPEYIRARHPARAEVDAGQAFYPTNRSINSRVWLIQADITKLKIDAVVNAANEQLRGGGGIDGAIHRAAGPELIQACGKLNGCPTGQAKITPGFKLPSRLWVRRCFISSSHPLSLSLFLSFLESVSEVALYFLLPHTCVFSSLTRALWNSVVHTVGPIGEKFESLRSAYHNSLEVAFNQPLPDPLEPGQQTILGKRPRDPEPIRTVALCGISTGIYGYPLVNASHSQLAV